MGQWIYGRKDPIQSFRVEKILRDSGQTKTIDNVSQGYAPTQEGTGVLYSWKNTPLAYVDIPTMNRMIFSRALWEGLIKNDYLLYALEGKSHWMGACHQDKDEVTFPEIAGRVTNLWIDSDMVMGDIDIMDTPNGLIIYNCAKTGRVANSSRGFGELRDRSDGLKDVVPEEYMHVSWDFVTFPAVNKCIMTMADDITSTSAVDTLSDYLKGLIGQAYDRNPENEALQKLYQTAGGLTKKSYDFTNQDWLKAELKKTLLSAEYKYTALRVAEKRARIESAKDAVGKDSFDRMGLVNNIKEGVRLVLKQRGIIGAWTSKSSSPNVGSSELSLNFTFSYGAVRKDVSFKQLEAHQLSVYVGGLEVANISKGSYITTEQVEAIIRSLGGR